MKKKYFVFLITLIINCIVSSLDSQAQYCTPKTSFVEPNIGILNFQVSTLNHASPSDEGYINYSAIADTPTFFLGSGYTRVIALDTGLLSSGSTFYTVIIWIDYNRDVDFNDMFEQTAIISVSRWDITSSPHILTIPEPFLPFPFLGAIPISADTGYTRMRIKATTSFSFDPCDTVDINGDIEDYTIRLRAKDMEVIDFKVEQTTLPCLCAPKTDEPILKISIKTEGHLNPLLLTDFNFSTMGSSNPGVDIANAKVFESVGGNMGAQFGGTIPTPNGAFTITGSKTLQTGYNEFFLTYDLPPGSTVGNVTDAELMNVILSGSPVIPDSVAPLGNQLIGQRRAGTKRETFVWQMSSKIGLDFNCEHPYPLTDGLLNTLEEATSISDKNGNLLFYGDGGRVYDATHNIMPNGNSMGSFGSTTMGALIVPKPESSTNYYYFSIPSQGSGPLYYSQIDMTLNGGLGDIIVGQKKIALNDSASERVVAVKNCNGVDYWVANPKGATNEIYVYPVTAGGIGAPIVNTAGWTMAWGNSGSGNNGGAKFSPNGKKLAVIYRSITDTLIGTSGVQVFDFDNATGILSNPINLLIDSGYFYGLSFSPDNSKLYLGTSGQRIYQFDMTMNTQAAIQATKRILINQSTPGNVFGDMQLAPDGKIYISLYSKGYISIIDNPNTLGATYIEKGIEISGRGYTRIGRMSLPNFAQDLTILDPEADFFFAENCVASPIIFTDSSLFVDATTIDEWLWNFDDTASGLLDSSSSANPQHTYNTAGTYDVQLIITEGCKKDTIVKTVVIAPLPSVIALPDTTVCPYATIQLNAVGAASYIWSPSSDLSNDTIANPQVAPDISVKYIVAGIDSNGCINKDTADLNVYPLPLVDAGSNTTICIEDSIQLQATGGDQYQWLNAVLLSDTTISNPIASPVNTITYYVKAVDSITTCSATDSVLITVKGLTKVAISINDSFKICQESSVQLNVSGANRYLWEPMIPINDLDSSNPKVSPDASTIYTVVGFDDCTSDTVSTVVEVINCTIFVPNAFSPNGDGENDIFQIRGDGISQFSLKIYDRWGNQVFENNGGTASVLGGSTLSGAEGWDATGYNKGVYVYHLEYTLLDGISNTINGNVTLIR